MDRAGPVAMLSRASSGILSSRSSGSGRSCSMLAILRESFLTPEKREDPNALTLKYVKKAAKKRNAKHRQLVNEEENRELRAIFNTLDADSSGFLDPIELKDAVEYVVRRAALADWTSSGDAELQFRKLFKRKDNLDNRPISFEEFRGAIGKAKLFVEETGSLSVSATLLTYFREFAVIHHRAIMLDMLNNAGGTVGDITKFNHYRSLFRMHGSLHRTPIDEEEEIKSHIMKLHKPEELTRQTRSSAVNQIHNMPAAGASGSTASRSRPTSSDNNFNSKMGGVGGVGDDDLLLTAATQLLSDHATRTGDYSVSLSGKKRNEKKKRAGGVAATLQQQQQRHINHHYPSSAPNSTPTTTSNSSSTISGGSIYISSSCSRRSNHTSSSRTHIVTTTASPATATATASGRSNSTTSATLTTTSPTAATGHERTHITSSATIDVVMALSSPVPALPPSNVYKEVFQLSKSFFLKKQGEGSYRRGGDSNSRSSMDNDPPRTQTPKYKHGDGGGGAAGLYHSYETSMSMQHEHGGHEHEQHGRKESEKGDNNDSEDEEQALSSSQDRHDHTIAVAGTPALKRTISFNLQPAPHSNSTPPPTTSTTVVRSSSDVVNLIHHTHTPTKLPPILSRSSSKKSSSILVHQEPSPHQQLQQSQVGEVDPAKSLPPQQSQAHAEAHAQSYPKPSDIVAKKTPTAAGATTTPSIHNHHPGIEENDPGTIKKAGGGDDGDDWGENSSYDSAEFSSVASNADDSNSDNDQDQYGGRTGRSSVSSRQSSSTSTAVTYRMGGDDVPFADDLFRQPHLISRIKASIGPLQPVQLKAIDHPTASPATRTTAGAMKRRRRRSRSKNSKSEDHIKTTSTSTFTSSLPSATNTNLTRTYTHTDDSIGRGYPGYGMKGGGGDLKTEEDMEDICKRLAAGESTTSLSFKRMCVIALQKGDKIEDSTRKAAMSAGFDWVLNKPFTYDQFFTLMKLANVIRIAGEQKRMPPPANRRRRQREETETTETTAAADGAADGAAGLLTSIAEADDDDDDDEDGGGDSRLDSNSDLSILVLDGSQRSRVQISALLSHHGHRVHVEDQTLDAIDLISASMNFYDVILMDLEMGLEPIKLLRYYEIKGRRREAASLNFKKKEKSNMTEKINHGRFSFPATHIPPAMKSVGRSLKALRSTQKEIHEAINAKSLNRKEEKGYMKTTAIRSMKSDDTKSTTHY